MDPYAVMESLLRRRRRALAEGLRRFGISPQQWRLIQLARRRGPVSPSEAAEELECDRPTATVVVRNCLYGGWLERLPSTLDGRSYLLRLSGAGEELLDAIERGRAATSLPDPLGLLAAEERAAFESSLSRLESALASAPRTH